MARNLHTLKPKRLSRNYCVDIEKNSAQQVRKSIMKVRFSQTLDKKRTAENESTKLESKLNTLYLMKSKKQDE